MNFKWRLIVLGQKRGDVYTIKDQTREVLTTIEAA
jgi:hypothetical protein